LSVSQAQHVWFSFLAHAQQQVALLQQELTIEAEWKHQAEAMAAELTVEVATGRAEIARLNTEMGKLRDQVNGKTSLALAILLKFLDRLFDVVDVCQDSAR
jgi:hypothetical protein